MSKPSLPLFFDIPQVDAKTFLKTSQILLINKFQKYKQQKTQKIIVILTNKYICLCEDDGQQEINLAHIKVKQITYIDFDLKFELVREQPTYQGNTTILGTPLSIRFDKTITYEPYQIFGTPEILLKWKDRLEIMINRRGFHNLFKPVKKIGKGNFASVYLAESIQYGKMVAVKAFSKQATYSQDKGKQSLMNQITILRKLNQQNIMKVYSVFQSDNSIYMTVQLLEGDQLFSKIQDKHKFTHQQTKQIMRGLLRGLAHMSQHRIIHRDLKPQNIMFKSLNSCEVAIGDFGLATFADENEYLFVRCGTPGYVAPEIINIRDMSTKSEPISDVFSVGLIFYILLMGRSVFPGRTYNDVLTQNRACDFNLDQFIYKVLPLQTHNLLKRMLDKDPCTRITADQALKHAYFSQSEIESFNDTINLVESPFFQLKENDLSNRQPIQNKVSICHKVQILKETILKPSGSLKGKPDQQNQNHSYQIQTKSKHQPLH